MITPKQVAEWMVSQVDASPYIYQETMAANIKKQFGDKFIYTNANGNPAINKEVLKHFRTLTEGKIVWEMSDKSWRKIRAGEIYKGRLVD
jgi:hypothetical protein